MSTQTVGDTALVNGLRIYYETYGPAADKNPPLILLHGGVGGIEMFGPNLPALASSRRVIGVDLQGHGHTSDIDRPLRYEWMGDDIAALIRHLGFAKADIMGYSLGAGAALQAAIRHPDVVRKLVIVSTTFKRNGWYPEVLEGMAKMGPAETEGMKQTPLYTLYPNVDWATLFTKLSDLLTRDYDWSNDVAALKLPVMLVFADADAVQPAHIMEFYRLLGGGLRDAGWDGSARPTARLAVIPGTTHYDILASSTIAAELVAPFLDLQTSQAR